VGAEVTVTLEIEATLADGALDQIVRTVSENSRTLKFTSHGFESEQGTGRSAPPLAIWTGSRVIDPPG